MNRILEVRARFHNFTLYFFHLSIDYIKKTMSIVASIVEASTNSTDLLRGTGYIIQDFVFQQNVPQH